MKRAVSLILILLFCLSCSCAPAERKAVVKDQYYLGAMRVVNCKKDVSLRDAPDKKSKVLAKVPAGAIVLYCNNNVKKYAQGQYRKQAPLFIRCEYEGQEGYILKKYLQRAPECEPAETRQNSDGMTKEQIAGSGTSILDWTEFNVSVQASYEEIPEDGDLWEYVHVGCFINDLPNWGYTEAVKQEGKPVTLKAFMGGSEDEPMVYVYDEEYGLTMLDLMDGTEIWTIMKGECMLGDAAVFASGQDTGILYIAGTDGPGPVAVSPEGTILWRADTGNPALSGPETITLNENDIEVAYQGGKTARFTFDGGLISITD